MAEQVGYVNPYRFQHLLGRAQWSADAVCAEVRQYAMEHLKSETDILAIDETGFLKQGEQSVGVQVQYYGTTGHLENCQVGVFMSYISDKGHTLIDRRLYLPRSWSEDQNKRKKGAIPEAIKFATSPQLAQQMLESAFKDGIRPTWFVALEVYGNDGSQAVVAGEDCQTTVYTHSQQEAACSYWMATLSSLRPSSAEG
ncbi:IS701 family transposase [Chroococcidiopsis thermalis]|nr:transposase [Chroococcidiopsis thermalis]